MQHEAACTSSAVFWDLLCNGSPTARVKRDMRGAFFTFALLWCVGQDAAAVAAAFDVWRLLLAGPHGSASKGLRGVNWNRPLPDPCCGSVYLRVGGFCFGTSGVSGCAVNGGCGSVVSKEASSCFACRAGIACSAGYVSVSSAARCSFLLPLHVLMHSGMALPGIAFLRDGQRARSVRDHCIFGASTSTSRIVMRHRSCQGLRWHLACGIGGQARCCEHGAPWLCACCACCCCCQSVLLVLLLPGGGICCCCVSAGLPAQLLVADFAGGTPGTYTLVTAPCSQLLMF